MRFADRFGLSMGPLVLRVLLALTFIWAGLGKVMTTIDVSPADAARLAQMKVAVASTPPAAPPPEASPGLQLPEPAPADTDQAPAQSPEQSPTQPPAEETPASNAPSLEEVSGQTGTLHPVSFLRLQSATTAQPDDFPDGATVRKLYGIALLIDSAANPGLDDESNPIRPIWPASMAKGSLPKNLAWLAALSEIGLGLTLLLGLLTRLSAFGIACVMGTAAWLTQIGPAIQAGNPRLGFLPTHDVFDVGAWQPFAWQLSLFMAALALICMGSGAIGLDRALFRREDRRPEPAPQPAPRADYREAEAVPDYDPTKNPFTDKVENDE